MHLKLPIGICVGMVVVGSSRDLVDLALNHFRGRGVCEANLNRSCSQKVVVARAGRKVVSARRTGRTF